MTLDLDIVRGRCQEIERSMRRLERIREAGRQDFLQNADSRDIACYRLLLAIEAALDPARVSAPAVQAWAGTDASPETRPLNLLV